MASIKLVNAAMDVAPPANGRGETIIIRGVIDPSCYDDLKVDTYQREIGSATKVSKLADALEKSSVPDIELGMRGEAVREHDGGKIFYLQDPTYIIDGLQRVSGGKYLRQMKPDSNPRIGCLVHLNTTFDWERERFRILNQDRSKLSVNVLMRNACPDYACLEMLNKLCEEKTFALHNRVCWSQAKLRNNILTALLLAKVTGILHSRFGPARSTRYDELATGIDKILEGPVGIKIMRENVRQFFDLMDRCFNIRNIVFAHGAPQVKGSFLCAMADVLTRHEDFWNDNRLQVSKDLERKIALFPKNDPEVVRLSGGNGQSKEMLMWLIINHINSGKRTRRLTMSKGFASETLPDEDGEGEDE